MINAKVNFKHEVKYFFHNIHLKKLIIKNDKFMNNNPRLSGRRNTLFIRLTKQCLVMLV